MPHGSPRSTMKNKAYDVSTYSFKENEIFLIDANIWLYIEGPFNGSPALAKKYSAALKTLFEAKGKIVINSLILSEYLNRYCRITWEAIHKATYPQFKDFRRSSDYPSVGQNAAQNANMLLKLCDRSNDHFDTADVTKVLTSFGAGSLDFNDALITESCLHHNWTLITHDGDFVDGGINILTANHKLLSACLC